MLSFIILFSLSLLLLTKLLCISSYKNKNKSKRLPPSPRSLPILGHLHLIKKPLHRSLSDLSSRYGPILLRLGVRRALLISSPSLPEECFTKNDIAFANRPKLPSARHLSDDHSTLSSASYGPHWRNLRRVAALEIFSSPLIHSFSASRVLEVKSLVRQLFRDSRSRQKVEMKSRLFDLVLNVMMEMIAGKRLKIFYSCILH